MTLTRELETLFFILIASAIGLFAVFSLRQPKPFTPVSVVASLPHFITADATQTPAVVSPIPTTTTTSWTSSDGTEKLTMKTTLTEGISNTYVFTLTNITANTTISLFTQSIPGVSSMSIPFNAFSPDNGYVFLKETLNGATHYLVFNTSGKAFASGQYFLDVTPIFTAYTSQYLLSDVTGWASETLLVINTKKQDGSIGPSFWLDVPSKSIIPLSTVFE